MMNNKTLNTIIAIGAVILVAVLGTIFVNMGMDWFDSLIKPNEWVPNIVIPIVWTVIYIAFAIYLYFAIKNDRLDKELIILLIVNGALNVAWCLLFFTLHSLLWGLIAIILNLIAGSVLLILMHKRDMFFSYFLTIYPLWLSIATCLNLACWILN
ncbi:MAG: TspO/MBR family protein [Clostridia bacterium]